MKQFSIYIHAMFSKDFTKEVLKLGVYVTWFVQAHLIGWISLETQERYNFFANSKKAIDNSE